MNSKHIMLQCIHEIPAGLAATFDNNDLSFPPLREEMSRRSINRVIVTGLGSSFTAALIARPLLEMFPMLPVSVISTGDLYAYEERWINHRTLVVAVSRSGERGWVVEGLKKAVARGALGAAITSNPKALLLEPADFRLLTGEGPELPFPKTKSVVACTGSLMQLGLALADASDETARGIQDSLRHAPEVLRTIIEFVEPQIKVQIDELSKLKFMLAGGSAGAYGAALEFALKLQETAQVPTSCWDSGNLLHGPWGPHDGQWLVAMLATSVDAEMTRQSFRLAGNLRTRCLGLTTQTADLEGTAQNIIEVPMPDTPCLSGLFFLPVVQLLTYYWAVELGLETDMPHQTKAVLNAILPEGRTEPEIPN